MAPVYVLDRYYLAITILVTTGYQLLGFAIAWTLQFDKITDFTGGRSQMISMLLPLTTPARRVELLHSRWVVDSSESRTAKLM